MGLNNLYAIAFSKLVVGMGQRGERTQTDQGRVTERAGDKLTLRSHQRDCKAWVGQAQVLCAGRPAKAATDNDDSGLSARLRSAGQQASERETSRPD